ncbi:conserved hypothetical protein [Trichinella spiralis]|uniref:hypothetical protein n=1 Tax=Trichinella spiralis TaxID=6334 RepID=UPI0001EFCBDB|nr:conserved hypothetical protein [Trichinella spiralis]
MYKISVFINSKKVKNLIIVLKRLIWRTGVKLKSDVAKFHFRRQLTVKMDGAKAHYNCEAESIFTVIDSLDYANLSSYPTVYFILFYAPYLKTCSVIAFWLTINLDSLFY